MVNMTNYEEYMLLYADRELSKEDEQALLAFVQQHPELKAELDAYTATISQPDTTVVFENKEALLQEPPAGRTIRLGSWKTYAAAASIIFIVVLFVLNRNDKQTEPPIAKKGTVTEPVTNPMPAEDNSVSPAGGDGTVAQKQPTVEAAIPAIKKVHSTEPVNAVAVETRLPDRQANRNKETTERKELVAANKRPYLATKRNKIQPAKVEEQPVMEELQPAPVAGVGIEQPIVKEQPAPEPVIAEVTEHVPQPGIPVPAPAEEVLPGQNANQKNRLIAAVVGPRPLILDELEAAVNEKVIIAKNVRNQLKDTDVTFKIGNKELFTVRL